MTSPPDGSVNPPVDPPSDASQTSGSAPGNASTAGGSAPGDVGPTGGSGPAGDARPTGDQRPARGRIVLLITSPRLPAGLLSAEAWDLVRSTPVYAAEPTEQSAALNAAGVPVAITARPVDELLAARTAVWLAGPTGDPDLARELGLRLVRAPGLADLEVLYGSWDPPGARLLDAVAVLDRLVSPGGDPWLAAITTSAGPGGAHRSLARFLLEEAYEALDAIDAGDDAALREELGDVLFQVVLHARLAHDNTDERRYGIDEVAGDLVAKLIRRNPHVFDDTSVADVDEIVGQWERIKRTEKSRTSALDGIALAQPALALAAKILSRAGRAGHRPPLPTGDDLGARLLRLTEQSLAAGEDAETALRRAVLAYVDRVRAAESAG